MKNKISDENFTKQLSQLESKIDVKKFDLFQLAEIVEGKLKNINFLIYAKPEFDFEQMKEIREGLEMKLDVTPYANPKFDDVQMFVLKTALKKGKNISKMLEQNNWLDMVNVEYPEEQL
jgi:hypothetical protein